LNANIYTRGNKHDYDNWVRGGAIGWSWAEVFPYFLKSEDNTDPHFLANGKTYFAAFLFNLFDFRATY
jgi:choline dehydrogenase